MRAGELEIHNLVSAGSYAEAIQALQGGSPFDVVYLDYPLGDATVGDVAQFIVTRLSRARRPRRVIVHATDRRGAQVIVTNRSSEPATALAHEIAPRSSRLVVDDVLGPTDGIVVALSGPWPIGRRDATTLAGTGPVVVDLSSPPAVRRRCARGAGRSVRLRRRPRRGARRGRSRRLRRRDEKLVSDTGRDYCAWLRARDSVPAIAAMAAAAEGRRHSEMAWLLRRLPDLNAEEQAVVEQMSHRLVAAILHGPMSALKSDYYDNR